MASGVRFARLLVAGLVAALAAIPSLGGAQVVLESDTTVLTDAERAGGLLQFVNEINRLGRTFHLGNIVGVSSVAQYPMIKEVLAKDFNLATAEFECKSHVTEPVQNRFNFTLCDQALAIARAANPDMIFRGHTPVWHARLPPFYWGSPVTQLPALMRNHVTNVVGRYAGKAHTWDVVNEPGQDSPPAPYNITNVLRNSIFMQRIGPEYFDIAFAAAKAADPNARLTINDYNTGISVGKTNAMFFLVDYLLSRNLPLDGVGFQLHMDTIGWKPNMTLLADYFDRLDKLGLEVDVTELDVVTGGNSTLELRKQAKLYGDTLRVCLNAPNCKLFTIWGVSDVNFWLGPQKFGLLYDADFKPKPGYFEVMAVLKNYAAKLRASASPSPSRSPSVSSISRSPSPSTSPSTSAQASVSPSVSRSPSPSSSASFSPSCTVSPSSTRSPDPSSSPSISARASASPTPSESPSLSSSPSGSAQASLSPTSSESPNKSSSPSGSAQASASPTPSESQYPSSSPSGSAQTSVSATPSKTPNPSNSPAGSTKASVSPTPRESLDPSSLSSTAGMASVSPTPSESPNPSSSPPSSVQASVSLTPRESLEPSSSPSGSAQTSASPTPSESLNPSSSPSSPPKVSASASATEAMPSPSSSVASRSRYESAAGRASMNNVGPAIVACAFVTVIVM